MSCLDETSDAVAAARALGAGFLAKDGIDGKAMAAEIERTIERHRARGR